jgi:hypothetical protein
MIVSYSHFIDYLKRNVRTGALCFNWHLRLFLSCMYTDNFKHKFSFSFDYSFINMLNYKLDYWLESVILTYIAFKLLIKKLLCVRLSSVLKLKLFEHSKRYDC